MPGMLLDLPRSLAGRPRHGYAGPRQRILVVDNEEADRELLVNLLSPLGFEMRIAASGHDCLDLIAAGYHPDVIFMDLAMPGIDGWETIRRVRALEGEKLSIGGHGAQGAAHVVNIAIVSANAFDKGLDNDVDVPAEDFILKPVRHSELLDWLERRLGLSWLETVLGAPAPAVPASVVELVYPEPRQLDALREVVSLGYYRGIMNLLDEIESTQPGCAPFVVAMRGLARQFQFEAIGVRLNQVTHDN